MIDITRCQSTNARGEPCDAPTALVRDGACAAHRPGGAEHLRAIAERGGAANKAKLAGAGFDAADLPAIITLEDAKLALDAVRVAILTRRITHAEGRAATSAIEAWVKAETATLTKRLETELRVELDSKTKEIATLRQQLSGRGKPVRALQAVP